ncbi:MAG: hypothetical protein HY423_08585 [Candidatus Lambdaproteobacteria bacterium]|nr:hypothetical protein [Candidatus Lambdaproteobacteria bacterium]
MERAAASDIIETCWGYLSKTSVVNPRRIRPEVFVWRRGSAQMVLRVNPELSNVTFYSVLVSDVRPSDALFRHLLQYNALQRREAMGLVEREGRLYVVMKYTLELELVTASSIQRHAYAMQEVADQLDTELAGTYGGQLHYEDWKKLDQSGVDTLLGSLFG